MTVLSPDHLLPQYPEFGKPRFPQLLQELRAMHPYISGPEEHGIGQIEHNATLFGRVYQPIEFQQANKGDDRIFTGFINHGQSTPILVVADGASDTITQSGSIVSGGGEAAHQAVLGTLDVLSENLTKGLDPLDVDDVLRGSFDRVVNRLQVKRIETGTTLLIAFPYIHQRKDSSGVALWHYGYIGDGRITILSPERKVDGRALSMNVLTQMNLLTEQKVDTTASIKASGFTVEPVIGTVSYASGDMMIVASDGIDGPAKQLMNDKRLFLSSLIAEEHHGDSGISIRIAERLRSYRFSDDAVIGIMSTTLSKP